MKKNILFLLLLLATSCNTQPTQISSQVPTAPAKIFTLAEITTANSADNCLTIINSQVYNLTDWINKHPGSQKEILSICGKDGTQAFLNQHQGEKKPTNILPNYLVGKILK